MNFYLRWCESCEAPLKLTKRAQAIKLRDKAIKVVRTKGKPSPVLTGKKVLLQTVTCRSGDLQIDYRIPYGPRDAAVAHSPHWLEIYCPNKVLCIEWDDAGSVRVVGFRPGAWEGRLDAAIR